jgi:AraC-like DNA-binding protein
MEQKATTRNFSSLVRAQGGASFILLGAMIALHTAMPSVALREFVRVYAQREVTAFESGAEYVTETIPSRLEQTLEFQLGAPLTVHHSRGHDLTAAKHDIVGAQVGGKAEIELRAGIISFAVFFTPTGMSRLFEIPASELSHRNYDAGIVLGGMCALRERLGACATFDQRVRVVEDALLPIAARTRRDSLMSRVAEHVFARRGDVGSMARLANDAGLGIRQFERLFSNEIGIQPKLYARVARFQSALDMKIAAPKLPWIEIAHKLSYHDQMHMIRDFQLLGGETPTELVGQIGDARPEAIAKAEAREIYFIR